MAKGYKVELVANQAVLRGERYERPFSTTVEEGHPNILAFQNSRAFKVTPVNIPEHSYIESTPPVPTGGVEEIDGTSIFDIEGIDEAIAKELSDAGFKTAEKILDDSTTLKDLTSIKGIGKATAEKIIASCEEALGLDEEDEE